MNNSIIYNQHPHLFKEVKNILITDPLISSCIEVNSESMLMELLKKMHYKLLVLVYQKQEKETLLLISKIKQHSPSTRILSIGDNYSSKFISSLFKYGITGITDSNSNNGELTKAVRQVILDEIFISDNIALKLIHQNNSHNKK